MLRERPAIAKYDYPLNLAYYRLVFSADLEDKAAEYLMVLGGKNTTEYEFRLNSEPQRKLRTID